MSHRASPRPKKQWNVLFITANQLIRRELAPLLSRTLANFSYSEISSSASPPEFASAIRAHSPDLCFLDFSNNSEVVLTVVVPNLLKVDPRLVIIGLLPGSEPGLVLRCLRQGATDFLMTPFDVGQVEAVVQKVLNRMPGAAARKPATVYALIPAKGACGSTTIACNLAYQWKRLGAERILLADLDPLTGTISFLLKVKSQHSFIDVLQRSSELDADLWNAMVVNRHGVDLLLAPEHMIQGADELVDPEPIIEFARLNYDVVILDAARVYGPWNLAQARLADEVLLVTTNELIALQAAQRALNYLEKNGVGRWKVQIVVNQYERQVGLSENIIATALNADVYHLLPSDYEGVQKALMEGKAILPSSSLGKALSRLGDRLAGRKDNARKRLVVGRTAIAVHADFELSSTTKCQHCFFTQARHWADFAVLQGLGTRLPLEALYPDSHLTRDLNGLAINPQRPIEELLSQEARPWYIRSL